MSFKEVNNLRKAGEINAALQMAKEDYGNNSDDIWNKRAYAWVLYELIKNSVNNGAYNDTMLVLDKISSLNLITGETLLQEQVAWQIGKAIFGIQRSKETLKNTEEKSNGDNPIICTEKHRIIFQEPFQYHKDGVLIKTESLKFHTDDGYSIVAPKNCIVNQPTSFFEGVDAIFTYKENNPNKIIKVDFSLENDNSQINHDQLLIKLLEYIKSFDFAKPSALYSFIFKAFYQALKDSPQFIEFADWWDLKNFRTEDYQIEKLPNGKEILSIVERAYINYAKHLLPNKQFIDIPLNKEKVEAFIPLLDNIVENYPQFQYPAYYKAKLLLALGNKDNLLSTLLTFAKKKKNDFWVWEIMSEAFLEDEEKVLACYCRALSCNSPEEMLVNIRQKTAALFIKRQLFNEARTEIELLIAVKNLKGHKIPNEVVQWQTQSWYKEATHSKNNLSFYQKYYELTDELLFGDVPEEFVIVEFVNSDRKMLNFIASEEKYGFLKYDRFIKDVKVGDILKVRFQSGSNDGLYKIYSLTKTEDEQFKKQFMKEVEGDVKIPEGKPFGFLNTVFIHPKLLSKNQWTNGMHIKGIAMKTFNSEKKQWGWKLIQTTSY